MPRRYEDFTVEVAARRDAAGGYEMRLLASPCGPGAAAVALPWSRDQMETLVRQVGAQVAASAGGSGAGDAGDWGDGIDGTGSGRDLLPAWRAQPGSEAPFGATFEQTGSHLFRGFVAGALREAYLLCLGRIGAATDRGLRIRIVLPVEGPDAGLLQAVPWELLRFQETRDFLARDPATPVVRLLPLPFAAAPWGEPAAAEPPRILVAIANPPGTPPLAADDERDRILAAWSGRDGVAVEVLPDCSLRSLSTALAAAPCHAVHLIAHGVFEPLSGAGSLLLWGARGRPERVSGALLGETLRAANRDRRPRIVFLNACRTSQVGVQPGQDPILSTAAALLRTGSPLVLAMQFPISDLGARVFSETLHRALAAGAGIDEAVTAGRLSLVQHDPRSREWVTPALFAALDDAEVLRPLCPPVIAPTPEEAPREQAGARGRRGSGDASLAQVRAVLDGRDFARAERLASAALDGGAEAADLHLCLALARLRGRRARHLRPSELRPIEEEARRAGQCSDCAAHHFALLLALVEDFYLANHLAPPRWSAGLLQAARGAARDGDGDARLTAWAPWTAAAAARIEQPPKEDRP